jgi:hypothetical protein
LGAEYDLLAIGLQEDATVDSPLMCDEEALLVDGLRSRYELLKIETLSGWGSTTFKALKNEWEYRPRGLRLAVFKRRQLNLSIYKVESMEIVSPGIRNWLTKGKGGVAINLCTSAGKICFLNIHLPFNSQSIIKDRQESLLWQATCLKSLHGWTVDAYNPDYLFLLGDLNFRVQIRTEHGATHIAKTLFERGEEYIRELLRDADELNLLLDYSRDTANSYNKLVPIMNEGINGAGPVFMPTCKMHQGRESPLTIDSYLLGYEDQRPPSWCDRILYETRSMDCNIQCTYYNRIEIGTMNLSDHTAVNGVYKIGIDE